MPGQITLITGRVDTALPIKRIHKPAEINSEMKSAFDGFLLGQGDRKSTIAASVKQVFSSKKTTPYKDSEAPEITKIFDKETIGYAPTKQAPHSKKTKERAPKIIALYKQAEETGKTKKFETALTKLAKAGGPPHDNAPKAFDILNTILDHGLAVSGKLIVDIATLVIDNPYSDNLQKKEAGDMRAYVRNSQLSKKLLSERDFGRRKSHKYVENLINTKGR